MSEKKQDIQEIEKQNTMLDLDEEATEVDLDYNEQLIFADEGDGDTALSGDAWKFLIVDDEEGIHRVTELALQGFSFEGRPVEMLFAASGAEAKQLLSKTFGYRGLFARCSDGK